MASAGGWFGVGAAGDRPVSVNAAGVGGSALTRVMVGTRLKPAALAMVDEAARSAGVSRSEMLRLLVVEALTARRAAGKL